MSTHLITLSNTPYKRNVERTHVPEREIMVQTFFGGTKNGKCLHIDVGTPGTFKHQDIVLTKHQAIILRDIINDNFGDQ